MGSSYSSSTVVQGTVDQGYESVRDLDHNDLYTALSASFFLIPTQLDP